MLCLWRPPRRLQAVASSGAETSEAEGSGEPRDTSDIRAAARRIGAHSEATWLSAADAIRAAMRP